MPSEKQMVSFQTEGDMAAQIERLEGRFDFESQSDMHRHIYRVGLREQRNPLMWRLKDRVIDWVSILGIGAVMVFLAGAVGVFELSQAAKFSVALVTAAVMLLAGYECARALAGTNAIGAWLRTIAGRERA